MGCEVVIYDFQLCHVEVSLLSGVNEKGPTLRSDLWSGSSVVKHSKEIVLMRGLLAFAAWSLCISIGAASHAAEPTAEMSPKLKEYLRVSFCHSLQCHTKDRRTPSHCDFEGYNKKKYSYLMSQADLISLTFDLTSSERDLVTKFRSDLEKAQIMDDFKFTKQHVQQCFSDLQAIFDENYEPTFNIELLK